MFDLGMTFDDFYMMHYYFTAYRLRHSSLCGKDVFAWTFALDQFVPCSCVLSPEQTTFLKCDETGF